MKNLTLFNSIPSNLVFQVWVSTINRQAESKNSLKRQSKNQTQTWHRYWSYQNKFKITMINMLKDLMKNVGKMHDQVGKMSRNIEIRRENQKEML